MLLSSRSFIRGLCIMAIALLFGGFSFNYPIGHISRSGPGLFPLMVSSILFLIGLIIAVRAYFTERVPLDYSVKNIALIVVSLVGFVLASQYLNMTLGIIFLVFVSSLAATSYSWVRNVKICVVLIAIAFAFKNFLGLSLPLY